MLQIVLVCELVLVESEHLVTGGVAEEGVAEEGVAEEGVAEEGVAEEGVAEEGVAEEGVAQASRAGVPITPTFDIEC